MDPPYCNVAEIIDKKKRKSSIFTLRPLVIYDVPFSVRTRVAWPLRPRAPGGKAIALLVLLLAANLSTADHAQPPRPRLIASLRTERTGCMAFSPDGKALAVCADEVGCNGHYEVTLWELATRQVRASLRGPSWATPVGVAFAPEGK